MKRGPRTLAVILSLVVMAGGTITVWSGDSHAQAKYPTRAIELVVANPPGGSIDLTARVAAAFLNKRWGVPVNVINKPGGKAIPGSYEVFNAAPNGYTMFNDSAGTSEFLVVSERNLPFDIMQRTYIGTHSAVSYILATPANSPYKTLQGLIAEAKNNPQNLRYASLAGTTSIELAIRQFFSAIGADISKTKAVLCDGGAAVVTLTAGGHVSLGSAGTSGWLPSIKAETVQPLFITSKERNPLLPEVPTSTEVGLPTVTATNWFGISGPPKLPTHVVEVWDAALKDMAKDPGVIAQFKNIGAVPLYLNGQETRKFITDNLEDLKKFWN